MSILKWLGLTSTKSDDAPADTRSVREIVDRLESLEPQRARHIASFAYILGRVANADLEISREETRAMERLVRDHGDLDEEQAILVVQIAKSQNRLAGGTEDYLVTRQFKELTDPDQRLKLLDCLFAISAADESVSSPEEALIRQVAHELGLSHQQFVAARAPYSDRRDVIKLTRETS